MSFPELSFPQIEQISRILGDTEKGFTGSEIGHYLTQYGINDISQSLTKWRRLNNAFTHRCKNDKSTNSVFGFIQYCFEPAQGIRNHERYNFLLEEINKVLMLVGIEIRDDGLFHSVQVASSLTEVGQRTKRLRDKLINMNAHHFVLNCCKEELLAEDYFHAVHEAAKSLCERVRIMTGLNSDGAELFQKAFALNYPLLALNSLRTSSEQNQQNGLKELLCGVTHMFRNVTAHELRIKWNVNESDAIDALIQISCLHKLIDKCVPVPHIGN